MVNERKTVDQLLAGKGVQNLLPAKLADVTKADAEYHAGTSNAWIEKNQLHAYRNVYFHSQVLDEVENDCDCNSVILELGAGVGFDAGLFMERSVPFRCYILSEIAEDLLEYANQANPVFRSKPVVFCCLDAGELKIESGQVDTIYMIAAFHHLPDRRKALSEMDRVLKPGGRVVLGIEPSRAWLKIMKIFTPLVRRLMSSRQHSAADEDAEGFTPGDFKMIAQETGWKLEKLVPVWFFAGFLHHGVELLYRAFKLKKRPRLPIFLERVVLVIDSVWFCLPFTRYTAWHYTAVFVKQGT